MPKSLDLTLGSSLGKFTISGMLVIAEGVHLPPDSKHPRGSFYVKHCPHLPHVATSLPPHKRPHSTESRRFWKRAVNLPFVNTILHTKNLRASNENHERTTKNKGITQNLISMSTWFSPCQQPWLCCEEDSSQEMSSTCRGTGGFRKWQACLRGTIFRGWRWGPLSGPGGKKCSPVALTVFLCASA